jgi:putative RecB family exonuclease
VKVDSPAALYLAGEAMIVTHNTGKVPAENDRFLDEKFFAMRAYAMLWNELHGSVPHELRLVYVAGGDRSAVRRKAVDDKLLKATKKQLRDMIKEIKASAAKGEWECRKQVLCQWCDFIDVCPLYHPELAGLPIGEIKTQFTTGALSD